MCDGWLGDYALFMAVKAAHGGEAVWSRWEPDIAARSRRRCRSGGHGWRKRSKRWNSRNICFSGSGGACTITQRERGIRIMGDLPIYVAHDSADVWANPDLFQLDAAGDPAVMSGVPPDYFSATGQLWGNPIYRWDRMAADRLPLVDRPAARGAGAVGYGAPGSFPRPGSLLGSAGGRDYGAERPVGEGSRARRCSKPWKARWANCRSWRKIWA
jgi:hypothetical protein